MDILVKTDRFQIRQNVLLICNLLQIFPAKILFDHFKKYMIELPITRKICALFLPCNMLLAIQPYFCSFTEQHEYYIRFQNSQTYTASKKSSHSWERQGRVNLLVNKGLFYYVPGTKEPIFKKMELRSKLTNFEKNNSCM